MSGLTKENGKEEEGDPFRGEQDVGIEICRCTMRHQIGEMCASDNSRSFQFQLLAIRSSCELQMEGYRERQGRLPHVAVGPVYTPMLRSPPGAYA